MVQQQQGNPPAPSLDMEAEESVVIAVLADPLNFVELSRVLVPDDFKTPVYKEIYRAALDCDMRGVAADAVTIGAALERVGYVPPHIPANWLPDLFQKVSAGAPLNFMSHAEIVRDRSLKRQSTRAAKRIAEAAAHPGKSGDQVVAVAEAAIQLLTASRMGKHAPEVVSVAEGINQLFTKLNNPEEEDNRWGVPTGFNALDANIGGMKPGQLVIIAARPAVGKTTLLMEILMNVASEAPEGRVVMFSHELTTEELVTRMLCIALNCPQQALLDGSLIAENPQAVNDAIAYLTALPIDIVAKNVPKSSGELVSFMRKHLRKYGKISAVAVDYVQMMEEGGGPGKANRSEELSKIVYALKELAKEQECPVIALSQLNRSSESRQDDRYIMSDLRESGGIEQAADHIWFLSRPGAHNPEKDPLAASIQQRKHRNGSSNNDFPLRWNPYSARYENPDQKGGLASQTSYYPDAF